MLYLWRGYVTLLLCIGLLSGVGIPRAAASDLFREAAVEHFPRAIPVPEITLPDVEGTKVALQSFKGQVVLMNFWTTW